MRALMPCEICGLFTLADTESETMTCCPNCEAPPVFEGVGWVVVAVGAVALALIWLLR